MFLASILVALPLIRSADLGSFSGCTGQDDCPVPANRVGEDCRHGEVVDGACAAPKHRVLLQKKQDKATAVLLSEEQGTGLTREDHSVRSRAEDARFLMHATFGPTPRSLEELKGTTYPAWIKAQAALPVEYHREWFRPRVNPKYTTEGRRTWQAPYYDWWPTAKPCKRGRFTEYAFTVWDRYAIQGWGRRLVITDTEVRVNGRLRTMRRPNDGLPTIDGQICAVQEGVNATVLIGYGNCANRRWEIPNVAIYMPSAKRVKGGRLTTVRPGVVLLDGNEEELCRELPEDPNRRPNLQEDVFIAKDGKHYRFDRRFHLEENTPESPSLESCVPIDGINEGRGCVINGNGACCGSPGEVASRPELGHHYFLNLGFEFEMPQHSDDGFMHMDGNRGGEQVFLVKSTIWSLKARTAQDQLRQRMAWALSQIFVASVPRVGMAKSTDCWLNFYDIFLRHGLGNFRDVLKEVTYSPIMGQMLDLANSRSADSFLRDRRSGSPNENFAREVMQIFTIGTDVLNPDGSAQTDSNGDVVPAYSNNDIISYARALSGLLIPGYRPHLEWTALGWGMRPVNYIDPMLVYWQYHDSHPKTDLLGGYIGDSLPLCSDLPAKAFLSQGARYRHTTRIPGKAILLDAGSRLRRALCPGGSCRTAVIDLPEDLACSGAECGHDDVDLVDLGGGMFFQFLKPACVHPYWPRPSAPGLEIEVAGDGGILVGPGGASFLPRWQGGAPAAGKHAIEVRTERAFDRVPTQQEAAAKLKVGAFAPKEGCSDRCKGEVQVYGKGAIDAETVFKVDGKFYKNVESTVHAGAASFRMPPTFLEGYGEGHARPHQVMHEVDSTLDSLFHHPNCPVHIAKRLIERFVTSNPSSAYIQAVAGAFRSGSYGGETYGGKYGDLAATVAAILLHPEARELQTAARSTVTGMLREPMLKMMHAFRSLDYRESMNASGNVPLRYLQDRIGQFPYEARTVFNFYGSSFQLPETMMAEPEPEPEPEPAGMERTAPEFEIFIPPYVVEYLNGMTEIMEHGVRDGCPYGKPGNWGLPAFRWNPWWGREQVMRNNFVCDQGSFFFGRGQSRDQAIEEMNVLLTGGRLSSESRALVRMAYDRAAEGHQLTDAQTALIMTPEFNVLGATLPLPGRKPQPVPQTGGDRPYKALIMVWLGGGADTWNLLVPQDCDLYEDYRAKRGVCALNPNELLRISTEGQTCSQWGVHHRAPFLRDLYSSQEAAFATNIGSIPGREGHCVGLFSHPGMSTGALTLKCQEGGITALGAGGRIADALQQTGFQTTSFSTAGANPWSQGDRVKREIVGGDGSTLRYAYLGKWKDVMDNITARYHGNRYAEAYTDILRESLDSTENLANVLSQARLAADWRRRDGIFGHLYQVARLIATRKERKVERDIFFIDSGRFWDHHQEVKRSMYDTVEHVDVGLRMIVTELKAQGVWDDVVLTISSEFGRTLNCNGNNGADHGWAGQTFIAGGSVVGGRIYNRYPSSMTQNRNDFGYGRFLPEYPWESVLAPLAQWLGVEAGQMSTVFPNYGNFDAHHFISGLFRN